MLLGNGDGAFKTAVTYIVGEYPTVVKVADFNHDGKQDLVNVNHNASTVSVLLGRGDGTFQPAIYYTAQNAAGITAVDFNGDRILDLATTHFLASNTISVLLSTPIPRPDHNTHNPLQPQQLLSPPLLQS